MSESIFAERTVQNLLDFEVQRAAVILKEAPEALEDEERA